MIKKLINFTLMVTFLLTVMTVSLFAAKATYVGTTKCKMCHMQQFKEWETMKHSKALSSLNDSQKKNKECLKCHVVGLGEGGYDPAKSAEENAGFDAVGCESCHGAGSEHKAAAKEQKKATISKDVKCTKCHNPHKKMEN